MKRLLKTKMTERFRFFNTQKYTFMKLNFVQSLTSFMLSFFSELFLLFTK